MRLEGIFNPGSVALIGASNKINTVGNGIARNLLQGGVFNSNNNIPFKGKKYFVNPNSPLILGHKSYKSILEIKSKVDLAIIAVNPKIVLGVVKECTEKKVKGIIVISAGFGELGEEGKRIQDAIVFLAKNAGIPLIGPNCLGIINTSSINATFAPATPKKGEIGFISQSGALADSIIDWSLTSNYGFSKIISYGNGAMLGVSDFITYLSRDNDTKAIAVYLEGVENGRLFMESVRTCKKPVIILKGGRTEQGSKAASTHTGSMTSSYDVYLAAFKQSGAIIANTIEELFEFARLLSITKECRGNGIGIVTNGGGCGVLAADYCIENGIVLPKLHEETIESIESRMHPAWSRSNPLDIVGDALPERYELAINALLKQKDIYGLIVLQTMQTMTQPIENAKVIVAASKKFNKPVLAVFMGGKLTKAGKSYLEVHSIPCYEFPEDAVFAMKALIFSKK